MKGSNPFVNHLNDFDTNHSTTFEDVAHEVGYIDVGGYVYKHIS